MPPSAGKPKLLIFVIAYYAESTLVWVLERIPRSVFDDFDCEVLVVDDASEDRTFAIGQEYRRSHPEIKMTVLRNEYNQGYGGNQKVGYSYASAGQFDFVALVHGDGQYAPEELPKLLEPLVEGSADAVFGSRMMEGFGALRGGMPLYKFVGNRILTGVQNALLGTRLTEFHSGYRIYRVRTLQRIRYLLNSNDFHFDTEIIIQLLNARARIVELPIPTYYGDEICRVNGMKYAKDVVKVTLQNTAHRSGLLYQRRYDPEDAPSLKHDLKLGYPSSHTYALAGLSPGARVLHLGAGPAGFTRELASKGCDTTVVDPDPPMDATDSGEVIMQELEEEPKFDPKQYDAILALDVIEHLHDPEHFLAQIRAQFDHQPKQLILTTPNIAFLVPRLMLLLGQFNYGKEGILDRTHKRLFTFRAIRQLLRDAGFRIREIKGVPAPLPKVLGTGRLGRAAVALNLGLIRLSKSLFSYEIYIEAESTPDTQFVVEDTRRQSARRAAAFARDQSAGDDPAILQPAAGDR
jgi:glycosyltransferase involved in cell wall biosynthesis